MRPTVGFCRRFFADTLDNIILFVPIFLLNLILFTVLFFVFGKINKDITSFMGPILSLLYFSIFESSSWKATLAQRCLRMNVCSLSFERLTFRQALWRGIVRYLLYIPLLLVFLLVGGIIYFCMLSFFAEPEAYFYTLAITIPIASISSLIIIYVRLFNGGRQSAVDYYSKTMMVFADPKTGT